MRQLTPAELLDSAKKCVGMNIVFIGNDIMPANCGKIVGVNENSESFLIKLNNDDSVYEIPFLSVMHHILGEFKEWVLEFVYDKIAKDYGLPPVAEMILADYQKRESKRKENIKMAEEKKAAKAAKEEAKRIAEIKKSEKEAAKAQADQYQLVVCKKDPNTKKSEYSRVGAKNDKVVTTVVKELLTDSTITSIQILVKK